MECNKCHETGHFAKECKVWHIDLFAIKTSPSFLLIKTILLKSHRKWTRKKQRLQYILRNRRNLNLKGKRFCLFRIQNQLLQKAQPQRILYPYIIHSTLRKIKKLSILLRLIKAARREFKDDYKERRRVCLSIWGREETNKIDQPIVMWMEQKKGKFWNKLCRVFDNTASLKDNLSICSLVKKEKYTKHLKKPHVQARTIVEFSTSNLPHYKEKKEQSMSRK